MNNINNDKYILSIINLLNDNYYLKGTLDNKEILLFYKEDDKIIVSSSLYRLSLTKDKFIELYKDYSFALIESKEEVSENKEKDLDYYSRLQKRG